MRLLHTHRKRKRIISSALGYVQNLCDLIVDTTSNEVKRFDLGVVDAKTMAVITRHVNIFDTDFSYEIDNYAIQHALQKHGADVLPLVAADLLRIPDILKNYSEMYVGRLTKQGNFSIIFKMYDHDITYVYVCELRTKHRTVSMKTMYKQKTPFATSYVDNRPRT